MTPSACGPSSAPSGRKMTAGVSDGARPSADRVRKQREQPRQRRRRRHAEPAIDRILSAELAAADVTRSAASRGATRRREELDHRGLDHGRRHDRGARRVAHDQTDQPSVDREQQRAVGDVALSTPVSAAGHRSCCRVPVRPMNTGCSVGPSIVAVASPRYANPANASDGRLDRAVAPSRQPDERDLTLRVGADDLDRLATSRRARSGIMPAGTRTSARSGRTRRPSASFDAARMTVAPAPRPPRAARPDAPVRAGRRRPWARSGSAVEAIASARSSNAARLTRFASGLGRRRRHVERGGRKPEPRQHQQHGQRHDDDQARAVASRVPTVPEVRSSFDPRVRNRFREARNRFWSVRRVGGTRQERASESCVHCCRGWPYRTTATCDGNRARTRPRQAPCREDVEQPPRTSRSRSRCRRRS